MHYCGIQKKILMFVMAYSPRILPQSSSQIWAIAMVEHKSKTDSIVVPLPIVEASKEVQSLTRKILGERKVAFVDLEEVDKILEEHEDREVLVDLDGKYHDLFQFQGVTATNVGEYLLLDKGLEIHGLELIELLLLHEKTYEQLFLRSKNPGASKFHEELSDRLDGLYPEALEQVAFEMGDIIEHHLVRLCVNALLVEKEGPRVEVLMKFILENFERTHPDYYQIDPIQLVGLLLNIAGVALIAEHHQLPNTLEIVPLYEGDIPDYAGDVYQSLKEHLRYLVKEPFSWESFNETGLNAARLLSEFVNNIHFGLFSRDFLEHVRDKLGFDFEDVVGQVMNSFVDPFDEESEEIDHAFVNSVRKYIYEVFYEALYFNQPIRWLDDALIVDIDTFWHDFDEYEDYPEEVDEEILGDDDLQGPFDL